MVDLYDPVDENTGATTAIIAELRVLISAKPRNTARPAQYVLLAGA